MMNRQITKDFRAVGKTIPYDTTIKNTCCREERKILFFLYTPLWALTGTLQIRLTKENLTGKKKQKFINACIMHTHRRIRS